ncbi:unnamed protein product [Rotaria magnacalcarata]|uniref:Uncharacterized protein n=1 Tax=Rotaria magnacalcarata TaxID=392030 RepID=A0A816VU73_9BILA|nr:unnamed protein product [Rotaria magnacalcarata]
MLPQRLKSMNVLFKNTSDGVNQSSMKRLVSTPPLNDISNDSSSSSSSSHLCETQQQIEWLPIVINRDVTRLCEKRPPMILDSVLQSIVPIFSQFSNTNEFYPLLANLPNRHLSDEEKHRRKSNRFHSKEIDIPIFNENEMIQPVRQLLDIYALKWNLNKTILVLNLNRLFSLLRRLTLKDFIFEHEKNSYQWTIEDWFIVLEFYLQMDASCFFMKTCTFRQANPRSNIEGLFSFDPPEANYGMRRCRDINCLVCYERFDLTYRFEPTIQFSDRQCHRFVNDYQVYLNCDVTCATSNIIYALTCPCHQYDFIGRCIKPFRDRMWQHRLIGSRLMSHFLLGLTVTNRLEVDRVPTLFNILSPTHSKIYQHSTTCPIAIGVYLKCQPDYWCLVPMTKEQAMIDDANITSTEKNLLYEYQASTTRETETTTLSEYIRPMTLIRWCVDHLPQPPTNYQFSFRQKIEQYTFFRNRIDRITTPFLDLYNGAIVIAVPETSSEAVRHLIQALLVVYAKPKLVVTTTTTDDTSNDDIWCRSLIHPRLL